MSAIKEKVRKITKKMLKFLGWTTGILVLLLVAAYFAFRSPAVQTWVSQKIANYMADELKTKISIQGVDIKFFTSIELEGLYIEDQHGDTLLNAPSFTVSLSLFNYGDQHVNVDAVTLTNANIALKKYEGDTGLNYRFILMYFKSTDTITKDDGEPWDVDLGRIALENCTFSYIDTRYDDVDRGMDYENILVNGIYATMERIEPMGDSTSIFLSELKASEQCGFTIDHMESRLMIADTFIKMNDLVIQTPASDIKGWIGFHFNSFDDIEDDFIHRVKMDGHFSESVVEMGDVAYFSPVMLGMQMKVLLTGDINGTVEKLKTRNMDIRFGKSSRIAGNFSFDGLPDIESADMHFKFKDSRTNYADLSAIPIAPFDGTDSSFLEVSERIAILGDMSFTGTVEGFLHDFVAHGKLKTGQGNLVLENLVMTEDSTKDDYNWDGILTAEDFNIGAFLGVDEMGRIDGTANMIGFGTDVASIVASMNANFNYFEYNSYRYSNITVTEGTLAKEVFDGVLDMHDPNIDLHYEGFVDFKDEKNPILQFEAHIDSADIDKLGFADTALGLMISTVDVRFAMQGSNIDNLDGSITLNNLAFTKEGASYNLNTMLIESDFNNDATRTLRFHSDFVIATMTGKFEVMKVGDAVADVMSAYIPAYFPPKVSDPKKKDAEGPQYFTLDINFLRNTDAVKAFVPKLMIAPQTFIQASLNQSQKKLSVNVGRCDSLTYGNYEFFDIFPVTVSGANGKADLLVAFERVQVNDSTGFDNVRIEAGAASNQLNAGLSWSNNTKEANMGKLQTTTIFESQKALRMTIDEGVLNFNDSMWQVASGNMIRLDSNVVQIDSLIFFSDNQTVSANGMISENPNHHLDIQVDRFNLATLNFFTEANDLTLGGFLAGKVQLSNLYNAPTFNGDATFDEFFFNKQRIGDGTATASYLPKKQEIFINANFWRTKDDKGEPINNINVMGSYFPKREENSLALEATLNQVPLGLIQPILADYCSVVNGYIGGQMKITGTLGHPKLDGGLDVQIRKVKVDYLGIELVQWQRPQHMNITENSFEFDNFTVSDNQGDTVVINGQLFHDNFTKFQFDMYFEFDHFMVLNTTEKDNEDYYGRVYASGYMDLFGYADQVITMDITATTMGVYRNGNPIVSDFNIPMSSASEAGENDFIIFEKEGDTTKLQKEDKKVFHDNGIELTLNLTVTDQALVHVIFDETVGDELSARGNGELTMKISRNGDFTMNGAYEVKRGDYMFTLKNVVYAPFELVEGGVLSWNGDPADARIDADAIYIANASVEPFFPYDSTTAAYRQNYPVNVIMHLDGQLMNPGLSFDIELPTADPSIQETVKSYTQSELEMNRQVLSLMVLNSFMTPSEFRDGSEDNSAGGAAGTTLLSNFVSGTLNNWLSQISDNANVKFKYRPNDDMSLQELKLALGTQLLNNRLTFDVAGSLHNASQTQVQGGYNQYVDVNVEYKVTEDGKVRLRAFNRGNEQSTIMQGANHTQGAGVFYREDFETFGELFQRYRDNWNKPANGAEKEKGNEQQQPNNDNVPAPDNTNPQDTLIN